ncbi:MULTISPECIES: alpha/beta hydrolase domain-containing protein [Streptomyces]|uniref:alpha/beta hydrolase domain-containing protein n=1 Tax=Streptomyces TaxID=1883 RepID=UPI002248AE8F|nr:alpha/beta hydrolase domain-containing protein [Streptomyces sp. JHD 1]MCX2970251.1 alpha/beta hydrolase domain-containing protein [Streptomyces sp. JHD 1]
MPQTGASHAFGGAAHQRVPERLERYGYTEGEYLVSGRANVYDWPEPGPARVRTGDAPYTTRMLVRQPENPRRFSGNVVVEMLNPSNMFDLNIGWAAMRRQIVRNGDAWVGITAKPVAVEALKNFDPQRYGALSMANPLPLHDERNCTDLQSLFPGDSSRATENGLVWDMYRQVGALLRSDRGTSPVRGVQKLYGFGYSQTGGYLQTYIGAVHPLDVRALGRPLFDGYIVAASGGRFVGAMPVNQCAAAPPPGDPRQRFRDVGVPIMHVMTQSDYLTGRDARRPDSDTPGDRFRYYEMAGAGHATPEELLYSASGADIEAAGRKVPPMACDEGPRSRLPGHIFFDAMLSNLDRWVRHGVAPPRAEPIEVADGEPVLDRFGNVRGGLRSPYLDVPTSTWNGSSTGASFCAIAGHEVPFTHERLRELYPSHGSYVRAVARSVRQLVADRFLTPADGRAVLREAASADVP